MSNAIFFIPTSSDSPPSSSKRGRFHPLAAGNYSFFGVSPISLKTTGQVNVTGTGFPPDWPGVHFGESHTTRSTSLSNAGSTPRRILTSSTDPTVTPAWQVYKYRNDPGQSPALAGVPPRKAGIRDCLPRVPSGKPKRSANP